MEVDKCDRLWVLDTGAINLANAVDQICPVKLDVFDLNTDRLVKRFVIPTNQTSKDSLFSNIVVETVNDNCEDAYAYLSDVFQYGLIVYSYKEVRRCTRPRPRALSNNRVISRSIFVIIFNIRNTIINELYHYSVSSAISRVSGDGGTVAYAFCRRRK